MVVFTGEYLLVKEGPPRSEPGEQDSLTRARLSVGTVAKPRYLKSTQRQLLVVLIFSTWRMNRTWRKRYPPSGITSGLGVINTSEIGDFEIHQLERSAGIELECSEAIRFVDFSRKLGPSWGKILGCDTDANA